MGSKGREAGDAATEEGRVSVAKHRKVVTLNSNVLDVSR